MTSFDSLLSRARSLTEAHDFEAEPSSPVGGWPSELAGCDVWLVRVWHGHTTGYLAEPVTAAEIRSCWASVAAGREPGLIRFGTRAWDLVARKLKKHGLLRFDRVERRWVALRVPVDAPPRGREDAGATEVHDGDEG